MSFNLKGATGATGATGSTGATGATGSAGSAGSITFIGQGVPNVNATYEPSNSTFDDSIGNDGDTFTDTLTNTLYIKVSGSWS